MLKKIPIQPGFNKEGTEYSASASWFDGDKVRFREGKPESIGGWVKYSATSYAGVSRSLFDWTTTSNINYVGIGTNLKFYVETSGQFYDITPIRATTADLSGLIHASMAIGVTDANATFVYGDTITGSPSGASADVFYHDRDAGIVYIDLNSLSGTFASGDTISDGGSKSATWASNAYSSYVFVIDTSHGAGQGDYVTFASITTGCGGAITTTVLNDDHRIAILVSTNVYGIDVGVDSNASDTVLAGASGTAEYQINVGTNNFVPSTGYGVGPYGSGPYGGGGTLSVSGQLRLYSQDEFGDDLIFNPRAGGIYYWDESAGVAVRAFDIADLPGASSTPEVALQVMMSQNDGHVIAFGTNPIGGTLDPMFIRWSDQESAAEWYPSISNSAGGYKLTSGSYILGAVKSRHEILVFTDSAIYVQRFVGSPYVFSFTVVSENVSMIAPKAAIAAGDNVFFMGKEGFYLYNGSVQRVPCTVLSYVYQNLDKGQTHKIFAAHNPENSEVTWFYPHKMVSTDNNVEVNHYVTFNYLEKLWTTGTFNRGAWIQANTKTYPLATSNDVANEETQYLYTQEYGFDAEDATIGAYVETGHMEISEGDSIMFVNRVIPDFKIFGNANSTELLVTINGNYWPSEPMGEMDSFTVDPNGTTYPDAQGSVRVRARAVQLNISMTGTGYGWRVGDFRFDMRTDGKR